MSISVNLSSTSTSNKTTLAQELNNLQTSKNSDIISAFSSSGDSLTESLLSASLDMYSISAVSSSLSSIASAAKKNDVSDVMNNVQQFAQSLKDDGYDTVSTLKYLSMVRDLAKNDPDKFSEMFAGDSKSGTSTTISSLTK